jgi:enoyl-CoA hydratase
MLSSLNCCEAPAGSEKAFAAGADIKEMKDKTFIESFKEDFISNWGDIAKSRKPLIAVTTLTCRACVRQPILTS